VKEKTRINLKFVDELPPKQSTAQGKPQRRRSIVDDYLNRLSKHPGKWAVYSKSMKAPANLYRYRKNYPNLEIATRNNGDGTKTVYVRIKHAVHTRSNA